MEHDFEVILVLDAGRAAFQAAVKKFLVMLGPGIVALVFYAGHGVQRPHRRPWPPISLRSRP